jgi:copper chaperone CopZ
VQDRFPDINGNDNRMRYVDQSVQPGDGGWGITTEISGFRRIKRLMIFGSGNYLVNPRNTNDTPSILVNLGIPNLTTPNNVNRVVNSVPDQYVARVGGSVLLGKGFAGSLAWRIEGMRRYDLIGRSDGFRRPGLEMFVEPGISYSMGNSSFSLNVPIGYYRNRKPDAYTGAFGDATFPKYIVLGAYSLRLGKDKSPAGTQLGPRNGFGGGGASDAAVLADPVVKPGEEFVRLNITGMTCAHCAETVRGALINVKGVTDAKVSLQAKLAVVTYEVTRVTAADLLAAVKNAKGMNEYSAELQPR